MDKSSDPPNVYPRTYFYFGPCSYYCTSSVLILTGKTPQLSEAPYQACVVPKYNMLHRIIYGAGLIIKQPYHIKNEALNVCHVHVYVCGGN